MIAGVRDDQLTDPTPCTDTSVAAMLDHFVGLTVAFRGRGEVAAGGRPVGATPTTCPPTGASGCREQLDALVAAWAQPSSGRGATEVAGVRMPAAAMGVVALNEVLVHGWDLAVATGQPYEVDPVAAQACLEFGGASPERPGDAQRDLRAGGAGAGRRPGIDRLLGQTGRDPAWKPS